MPSSFEVFCMLFTAGLAFRLGTITVEWGLSLVDKLFEKIRDLLD
ncbi:hypothetical protein [Maridesulfovibrio sp.]|nr:hypothetical protein [Maridesulfovibrio sp.]